MGRVPQIALGIAGHVMGRDLDSRQFVFSDHHAGLAALRAGQHDERRVLGLRSTHRGQPFDQPGLLVGAPAAAFVDIDERRAGAVNHAIDDLAPAGLVIMIAEYLLIGMAKVAIVREQLFLRPGAGQAQQPFRSGHLGGDLRHRRQRVLIGHVIERNVGKRGRPLDVDALFHERLEFARPRNAQRIAPGVEGGELVAAFRIAVDRGAHRVLFGDQLHHDAFEQFAFLGFHHTGRSAGEPRRVGLGRRRCSREP